MNKNRLILIISFILIAINTKAIVKLPAVFSDNMVLQQQSSVPFWGSAAAGKTLKITTSWDKKVIETTVGTDGNWKAMVPTPAYGGPFTIELNDGTSLLLHNVMIGEVWICSGQSNMEFSLAKGLSWKTGVDNWEKEVAEANVPELRLFMVKIKKSDTPLTDCEGEWVVCTPKNVGTFSAVGYYFGRYLTQQLHQPVGMVQTAVGGTRAELWTKMKVMESDTLYKVVFDQYQSDLKKYEAYAVALKQWNEKTNNGKDSTVKIAPPVKVGQPSKPACLWNAMVEPLLPLTIKGAIWYQGESNEPQAYDYRFVFANMINSWRKEWKQGDFPFYFVQIAAHKDKTPLLRYSQTYVMNTVKNTGMAVATDVGDSLNIHPRNKTIIGERLAYWALAKDYGFKNVTFSGPVYKSMKINGKTIQLSFDFAEKGLMAKGGSLREFEIAGTDKQFYPAEAFIKDNTVVVFAIPVVHPVYVRYAWKNFMHPNFYNQQGLPAVPFNTEK